MITYQNYNEVLRNLNILYIEDQQNIRKNIKKVLDLVCKEVFDAKDVKHAKDILKEKRVDIIISDINIPDLDGISFIEELREKNKKIPVILLTAYTDTKYLLKATKLKLVDYLTKPINFDELNNALHKSVEEIIDNKMYIIEFENNTHYNLIEKKLKIEDETINLTSKELMLLDYLIKHSTRVIPHEELKSNIWDDYIEASDSALKNLLNKLRKKIGKNTISNIPTVGYRINI